MTPSERDIAALQGRWEQTGLEVDGVIDPPDAYGTDLRTTIAEDRFTVHAPDGTVVLAGAFMIDASTEPKSIDWIDSMGEDIGVRLRAIYTLDGDRFVFNVGGDVRPTVFKTVVGQTMRALCRVA